MDETSRQQIEPIKENARISSSIEKLRIKLRDFIVVNRQGQLVGKVKDLILESDHQISFLVSQNSSEQSSRLFLLTSKLVQKVDPSNQSVIVDINEAEIEHFPEYVTTETPGMETSDIPDSIGTDVTSAVNDIPDSDIFSLDIDTTSTADVTSAGMQQEMMQVDVAMADADFNLDTATSNVGSASIQEQANERTLPTATPEVLEEEIIRLLGERLVVDRSKRKVGEVIVRKEIETRMVQVPVRHEKLIVEQVSPEHKQLAEIDLGQEILAVELNTPEITENKLSKTVSLGNEFTATGEFSSAKIASLLLNAIALERRQGCKKVRVEIVVEDAERQKTYQEWVDRCSDGKLPDSNL